MPGRIRNVGLLHPKPDLARLRVKLPGSLPGAEQTPQQYELADVVRVVIGHQQGFAKQRLPVSMRNRSEEAVGRVFDELLHFGQISLEGRDTRVPRCRIWRSITLWPVALRPLRRFMFRVPAEFKNVPLSDAKVLEKPPRRERQIFQARSPKPFGQTLDSLRRNQHELPGHATIQSNVSGERPPRETFPMKAFWRCVVLLSS